MVKFKTDGIIFDLDGTLWDAVDVIIEAWNEIISRHPLIRNHPLCKAELKGYMGTQLPQIAEKMFPKATAAERATLIAECCALEHEYLMRHGGMLYPQLEETLQALAQARIPLFIVSNCEEGYIECFLEYSKLEKYFLDYICAGNAGFTKGENIKLIMKRNRLHSPIYVGDTQGDAQSASDANIPFVWASYGFGKPNSSTAEIKSLAELLNIIELS